MCLVNFHRMIRYVLTAEFSPTGHCSISVTSTENFVAHSHSVVFLDDSFCTRLANLYPDSRITTALRSLYRL
jgi:hypothetical protein